jgi:hypothetical protein
MASDFHVENHVEKDPRRAIALQLANTSLLLDLDHQLAILRLARFKELHSLQDTVPPDSIDKLILERLNSPAVQKPLKLRNKSHDGLSDVIAGGMLCVGPAHCSKADAVRIEAVGELRVRTKSHIQISTW